MLLTVVRAMTKIRVKRVHIYRIIKKKKKKKTTSNENKTKAWFSHSVFVSYTRPSIMLLAKCVMKWVALRWLICSSVSRGITSWLTMAILYNTFKYVVHTLCLWILTQVFHVKSYSYIIANEFLIWFGCSSSQFSPIALSLARLQMPVLGFCMCKSKRRWRRMGWWWWWW